MTNAVSDMLGTVIEGRYRLAARLGDGAVGSVYRAEDLSGGESLAIKIWRTSVLDSLSAGRFHRETKALATLEHPHIVAIRDYGLIDGMPFLAMELLHGSSLAEHQEQNGVLVPEEALAILAQMLDALAYAHARNVVHRDLKPENVFLSATPGRQPIVKLLDYGLAKFLLAEDDPVAGSVLTRKGIMVGTPLYVAPEQALGADVDARADVYSVGCVLFEMLTGRPPFLADTITDLLRAHLASPVPRLQAFVPQLTGEETLQALIDRALAKDANDRFAHAGEMLRALPARTPRLSLPMRPPEVPEKPRFSDISVTSEVSYPSEPAGNRTWLWLLFALLAGAALLRWQL